MSAVLVAFLLAAAAGWFVTFVGFAALWLVGLVLFAIFGIPAGSPVSLYFIDLFAVGVAAQVGYFASVVLRLMFLPTGKPAQKAPARGLFGRIFRQSPRDLA